MILFHQYTFFCTESYFFLKNDTVIPFNVLNHNCFFKRYVILLDFLIHTFFGKRFTVILLNYWIILFGFNHDFSKKGILSYIWSCQIILFFGSMILFQTKVYSVPFGFVQWHIKTDLSRSIYSQYNSPQTSLTGIQDRLRPVRPPLTQYLHHHTPPRWQLVLLRIQTQVGNLWQLVTYVECVDSRVMHLCMSFTGTWSNSHTGIARHGPCITPDDALTLLNAHLLTLNNALPSWFPTAESVIALEFSLCRTVPWYFKVLKGIVWLIGSGMIGVSLSIHYISIT